MELEISGANQIVDVFEDKFYAIDGGSVELWTRKMATEGTGKKEEEKETTKRNKVF